MNEIIKGSLDEIVEAITSNISMTSGCEYCEHEVDVDDILTALERFVVVDEKDKLTEELEREKNYNKHLSANWLTCCNDLERQIKSLEVQLGERTEQLEGAFQLHRSLEWKLNAANKRISELEKPVVIYGEPLRTTPKKGGDDEG